MGEIFIVGGGVVGLCAGVRLAEAGASVTLVDKAPGAPLGSGPHTFNTPQPPSWGNAGHIAVEQTAPLASGAMIRSAPKRLFSLGGALGLPLNAISAWAPFAARLVRAATPARFAAGHRALKGLLADALPAWKDMAATIEAPDVVRDEGHIVVWESPESAARGYAAWQGEDIGTATLDHLDARTLMDAQALVRGGVTLADGIRFSHTGQISDLTRLQASLRAHFERLGGTIITGTATLARNGNRASVRLEGGETLTPETVLVTAGVGAGQIMEALGHRVPIIAERGYHIRASAQDWPADMPPLVFEDRSMIVTRYADCVQAASFVEFGRPDAPADPAKWDRLERHIADLGLPFGTRLQRWIGARPTLPDYLPAIGRSNLADNLVYAFGHQHLGLTLAPVTAGLVTDIISGTSPRLDLAPLAVERFGFRKETA